MTRQDNDCLLLYIFNVFLLLANFTKKVIDIEPLLSV